MRNSLGWCRLAPTLVGRCGCMHLTLCYLFTCICARDRSGYVRARRSFPVETGPRGPVEVSGDSTTPPTGASEPRSKSRTGSAEASRSMLAL
ncbi:hypothetical protein Taro_041511, partial [Colocasia esculenta]|nr:hypothetical protein [Colocasia esculenta]